MVGDHLSLGELAPPLPAYAGQAPRYAQSMISWRFACTQPGI